MKAIINNETIDLLLNHETSFLKSLLGKSVSIVGNSGILLEKEYGEQIDEAEVVVRFGDAPVLGFEKHVGAQSDIRVVNSHNFAGTSDLNKFPDMDLNFFPNLRGEVLIVKSWIPHEFMLGVLRTTPQNNVYFMNPSFTNYCNQLTGRQEATCGLVGTFFMALFARQISCFGFNFYKGDWDKKNYYTRMRPYKQGHDFDREEEIFTQLEQDGKIKIYK
tara:strand:+ start:441 stop:1094 length:654 start_codon:yes stop_codon:yes gene_type:complete